MVQWIKLENFRCPAKSCAGGTRGNNWVCTKDNRSMWINEKGIMECTPGTHTGRVIEWKWNCGSSNHKGKFLGADFEGFTFAMSQAAQLTSKAGSEWVASLIRELGKQYRRW